MHSAKLIVKGAREHNLKNIDVEMPRDKLIVITGLSGSGKSSLAFDTIYAEGQRRYVESLSAYARQFLGLMEKPDVDSIEGLSPAISIEQKTTSKNPRSTVATVTEIYDYLRLLFARIGIPYCYKCGKRIDRQTIDQIVDNVLKLPENTKIQILAPIVRGRKGEYKKILENIQKDGFLRVRVDGQIYELSEDIKMDKNKKHTIEVIVDRLVVKKDIEKRLADSLETALSLASGIVLVDVANSPPTELLFSQHLACPDCGVSYEELAPRMFSFNSPFGACPTCSGLGVKMEIDPALVVPNPNLSISEGAIGAWGDVEGSYYGMIMRALSKKYKFSLDTPFNKLDPKIQKMILYGTGNEMINFEWERSDGYGRGEWLGKFEGVIPNLKRRYRETKSEDMREWMEGFMSTSPCPDCKGLRLKPESRSIKIGNLSITEVTAMSIKQAYKFFNEIKLTQREEQIAHQILKELKERLSFLVNVGVDYLTLDRTAGTLSGGEAQRIRLATQIGSSLVGVLYILDEPSIGLHQRDNQKLLNTLIRLRDLGNTIIVVEHDKDTILSADYVVDLGPRAGVHGGEVVVAGTPNDVMKCEQSLTGRFLSETDKIPIPIGRRQPNGKYLTVLGAEENNLKSIDVKFPLGLFIGITGVSGSGKSTLVNEILYKSLANKLYHSKDIPGKHKGIKGLEYIDKVINIDQSPIGRTPRSNPATYTGLFTHIRDLYSQLPEAKIRGYKPGRFSFNVKGGRCEACEGDGVTKIEMHFLPDVYVPCEVCKGNRYNRETLEVKYKGKNIADVLKMTVDTALSFFENIPSIVRPLKTLSEVGLGYIELGQPATTLSGGEAQRVKLATELSKRGTGKTLYILDEPTTGLHFADIKLLLDVLNKLVDKGNTVIVIEHNIDVIKTVDYIIDLGPEGGDDGGRIVAEGMPEEVAKVKESYTGQFIGKLLGK